MTENPYERAITWRRVADVDFPYAADVDGQAWRLRLGDFPLEPLYTLVVGDEDIDAFDDWPELWVRPPG